MTGTRREDVLAIIPARGGSKGVPRKNVRPFGGKPLIVWTITAAQAARSVGRILVSTDDPEIAATAQAAGAEVPFLRPAHLAEDTTPDLPVCRHVLEMLGPAAPPIVVWLRPTAPLRTAEDIDAAIAILDRSGADSVRSVTTSKAHPYWMKTIDNGLLRTFVEGHDERRYPNRQSLPPVYLLNGAVDVTRTRTVLEQNMLWGERIAAYVMPAERSVDLDTLADFALAEALRASERPS